MALPEWHQPQSIYNQKGHANRRAYLESLAVEFGLPNETVFLAARMLGPSEDFDGLITTLEDEAESMGGE